jgi:hypothetical protein
MLSHLGDIAFHVKIWMVNESSTRDEQLTESTIDDYDSAGRRTSRDCGGSNCDAQYTHSRVCLYMSQLSLLKIVSLSLLPPTYLHFSRTYI